MAKEVEEEATAEVATEEEVTVDSDMARAIHCNIYVILCIRVCWACVVCSVSFFCDYRVKGECLYLNGCINTFC